uniref:OSIGBa0142I02-OSIGBa0101B20.9 protein n=1 Tax=Oryza sativa TaxID=4530 RepID=Q01HI0_ORYSA|nr:OSIGBa0142I02-OSIGBa0101B20.9 [Oryza sativa]
MTKPPSKTEVEPANVIPVTLEDFEGEDRKAMDEYINELTREALMRASTRTRQGVIIKPGPRPKLAPDLVSNDEVTQSIQQQVASTIDSSMIAFKDKLDATFEGKFDEFLRVKFGPLMADYMSKDKASTTANQPPIDQTGIRTDGAVHTASPTGPDGRSDCNLAIGPTGQTAGQTGYYPGGQTGTQAGPTVPLDAGQTGPWAGQTDAFDLVGLAFNGLIAPLRERLDGQQFFDVSQLMQRALAQESRVKDNKKLVRSYDKKPNVNVQSAIDEGRLKFTDGSKMKLDHDPFLVNTINFNNKKVLIRPEQAESTKGKGVIIGEPRPKMIVPKKPEKYEKQGGEKIRNKDKRPRSPPRERFGHSPRWSHSLSSSYHHPQDMSWGSYPNAAAAGYPYPYFMPWGATPPMFNHMPPMQFNQGWGGPRRPIHEHLSSPNNSRFYGKNQANEEKREGKRVKVEARTSEVITIKVGSHDVQIPSGDGVGVSLNKKSEADTSSSQSAGLTGPSGRSDRSHVAGRSDRAPNVSLTSASSQSDRWSTSGLTGLQRRFDRRIAKGDVRASSSPSKINRGHYLPPGTEPNPRWMPMDWTTTQKRRLQRFRAQEIREKKAEEQRDKRFNELRPPPVWRRKSIEKEKPVVVEEKEEQSVDKGESSPKEDMDINMVCMLPMEFCAMDEAEVAQFSLGPKDVVFEKPDESNRHMKPLYLKGHVDGKPVSRMLVDGGAAVNLMSYSLFKKLGREDDELKKTNMILNSFNGEPTEAKGIFSAELTVGNRTLPTAFSSSMCKVTTMLFWVVVGFMPIVVCLLPCINV